jgi:predicted nucleic acid-binding protein
MSALRAVFVDTGAWVALRYGRDHYHGRARTLLQRLQAAVNSFRVRPYTTSSLLNLAISSAL